MSVESTKCTINLCLNYTMRIYFLCVYAAWIKGFIKSIQNIKKGEQINHTEIYQFKSLFKILLIFGYFS